MTEMIELSWFVLFMGPIFLFVSMMGFVVLVMGINDLSWRLTVIGLLMIFLVVAYIIGETSGKAEMSGVPIKLENLHKDKVFSVVEMLGKSEKSQNYKNLVLVKKELCDDKKEKCARIVAVTLSGLPAPGKSFFLKEINGKITVFPVPNP